MAYARELERGPDNTIPKGTPVVRVKVETKRGERTVSSNSDAIVIVTLSEALGEKGFKGGDLVRELDTVSVDANRTIRHENLPIRIVEIHPDSGNVMGEASDDPVARLLRKMDLKASATKDDGSEKLKLTVTTVSVAV